MNIIKITIFLKEALPLSFVLKTSNLEEANNLQAKGKGSPRPVAEAVSSATKKTGLKIQ